VITTPGKSIFISFIPKGYFVYRRQIVTARSSTLFRSCQAGGEESNKAGGPVGDWFKAPAFQATEAAARGSVRF
jgi:hypothetical protein